MICQRSDEKEMGGWSVYFSLCCFEEDAKVCPDSLKVQPTTYHNRTGHTLPDNKNKMQKHINDLVQYSTDSFMKINKTKTKAAIFNPLRSIDIQPKIILDENEQSENEVVDEVKLLGQIITTDMTTTKTTRNMWRNASRMNMLRRLSAWGCPKPELLDVLRQQVLVMVEQAVPYWGPMITKAESDMLERVLKTGLLTIFQVEYRGRGKQGVFGVMSQSFLATLFYLTNMV